MSWDLKVSESTVGPASRGKILRTRSHSPAEEQTRDHTLVQRQQLSLYHILAGPCPLNHGCHGNEWATTMRDNGRYERCLALPAWDMLRAAAGRVTHTLIVHLAVCLATHTCSVQLGYSSSLNVCCMCLIVSFPFLQL